MKKNIIWLLTAVMSITFGALLYFQIMYLEKMVKMREAQFSETVMRCLSTTADVLEKNETLRFLSEDINILETGLDFLPEKFNYYTASPGQLTIASGDSTFHLELDFEKIQNSNPIIKTGNDNLGQRYREMQATIRSQYLYQKGLLNEVILTIMRDAGSHAATERADSTFIRQFLTEQLNNSGMELPFNFGVANANNYILYSTTGFKNELPKVSYSQPLFSNTDTPLKLIVEFPTKKNYIFSSVRFVIPTLAFTLILLVIFLFTILLAFRQKKLSEIKTDFINNMTHELKTPISTISLAAQMLADDSVRKSPSSLAHLSQVITDESKRLRFQVEKVLQMSVFEDSNASLKFTEVNANDIIKNVIHTFKIKAEKFGGSISADFGAHDAYINVDEMHFTNIIYNLLDNAVKYRDPDTPPKLSVSTRDVENKYLEIRIRDNGIGIRKDDVKKIFDKFYRVSTGNLHDVKGFGLGLAYVKKMVTLFKGSISVESELGKGSTFIILLPLVYDEH